MKKTFTIFLSAIVLVASLGVTGAFASDVFSDFPSFGVNILTVPLGRIFFKVDPSDVLSTDQNSPDVLFNNVVAYKDPGTGLLKIGILRSSDNTYVYASGGWSSTRYLFYSYQNVGQTPSLYQSYTGSFGAAGSGSSLNTAFSDSATNVSLNSNDEYLLEPSTVGEWVNFSIKPGYAFVIEGECEILERSYYINNSWSFFGTNNAHRTNGSSERISAIGNIRDGFSVDYGLARDQLIQWEAQNPNLVGDASIYEFYNNDLISLSSGSAFFISYPLYDGVQTTLEGLRSRENSVDFIGSVYLNYSTRPTFRYVALKSNIDANNKDVAFYNTLQPSITDSSGDVTETPDGTTISPGDIPSGGGDSSTPPLDEDNSLLGTISKFVNDIKRLLSTAVESINTLVAEGSQFMRSVAQMFTWLPEQLTSLLIAAFTILVVVGVLKVLWR